MRGRGNSGSFEALTVNMTNGDRAAFKKTVARLDNNRLARECAKLDKAQEQKLADEGLCIERGSSPTVREGSGILI